MAGSTTSASRFFAFAACAFLAPTAGVAQTPCGDVHYGPATPGSGGIAPTIRVTSQPLLGNGTFGLRADRALGGALTARLLGFGPASTTVVGAELLVQAPIVELTRATGTTAGAGEAAFPLPLPADPSLADLPLHAQILTVDPGAVGGLATSDAIRFRLRLNNLLGAVSVYQGPQASDAFSAMHYVGNGTILAGRRSSTAGTRFLRSTDDGANWQVVGCPGSTGAHTYFFGQNGSTVLSGTGDTGSACVMRSVDRGASWSVVLTAAQLRALLGTSSARAVFGTVHLGGGHWLVNVKTLDTRSALIESFDDGVTWRLAAAQPGSGSGSWARQMIRTSDGVLLWPSVLTDRMWRSTDQGRSWSVATVPGARLFQPLCDAGNGVYLCGEATTAPNDPIRLFRSADRGATWAVVASVNLKQPSVTYWRDVIAVRGRLFASACCREASSQERFMQLFTSIDAGRTWCSLGNPFDGPFGRMQAIYQMCANDSGEVFAGCQPDATILRWSLPLPRP